MISRLSVPAVEGLPHRRTALIVDDVEDMLDLLEIALDAADFSVLRASSVSHARELFAAHGDEIDLLMTDVRVGTDSGLDLAERFLHLKPSLPVLVMSGFALQGRIVDGDCKIDFLAKPFSTSQLKQKLQTIFGAKTAGVPVSASSWFHS